MTKSSVPKGATKKDICKCGRFYYKVLLRSGKVTNECSICKALPEEKAR